MSVQLLGVVGWSGSGKTTLLEFLISELGKHGKKLNVIKHSHHDVILEPPHKDSARFRAAGAGEVMLVSPYRYAIVHELHHTPEPSLEACCLDLRRRTLYWLKDINGLRSLNSKCSDPILGEMRISGMIKISSPSHRILRRPVICERASFGWI